MWLQVKYFDHAHEVAAFLMAKGVPYSYRVTRNGWHMFSSGDSSEHDFLAVCDKTHAAVSAGDYADSLGRGA